MPAARANRYLSVTQERPGFPAASSPQPRPQPAAEFGQLGDPERLGEQHVQQQRAAAADDDRDDAEGGAGGEEDADGEGDRQREDRAGDGRQVHADQADGDQPAVQPAHPPGQHAPRDDRADQVGQPEGGGHSLHHMADGQHRE